MKKLYSFIISLIILFTLSNFPTYASNVVHNYYDKTGQAYTNVIEQHKHHKIYNKGTEVLRDRILDSLRKLGELK